MDLRTSMALDLEPAAQNAPEQDAGHPAAFRIALADEAATMRLGEDLAMALKAGDLVALSGALGAGKSTLARALIRALAADPALEVPSPTYTLVQAYPGALPVAHFDLYRLGDPAELDELGFDEALETGAVICEWPENGGAALDAASLFVRLDTPHEGGRIATISGAEGATLRLARSLAARDFLSGAGAPHGRRRRFTGDASTRRYETVEGAGPVKVLMDAPRQPDGKPIRGGLPYSRIAHLAEDVAPFVALAKALRQAGFAAPDIHSADLDRGFVLLEHLGAETLLDEAGRPVPERYEAAALCLCDLHARRWEPTIEVADGVLHAIPAYDRGAMAIEVELLIDWYLPHVRGEAASDEERERYLAVWNALFDELAEAEQSLVMRDYHSPNIIWRDGEDGVRRIGLLDFQDAMIGPAAYDLASLAQDARVDIPAELEARLVAAYAAARRTAGPFDGFAFERAYAIMAAQRASKILGIFVRLLVRDGKPQYLRHIPRVRSYLKRTLGHPALSDLSALYEDWGLFAAEAPKAPAGPKTR